MWVDPWRQVLRSCPSLCSYLLSLWYTYLFLFFAYHPRSVSKLTFLLLTQSRLIHSLHLRLIKDVCHQYSFPAYPWWHLLNVALLFQCFLDARYFLNQLTTHASGCFRPQSLHWLDPLSTASYKSEIVILSDWTIFACLLFVATRT